MSSWMTYLCSDLVSALAGLDVDDLPHGVAVLVVKCCSGGEDPGNAEPGTPVSDLDSVT